MTGPKKVKEDMEFLLCCKNTHRNTYFKKYLSTGKNKHHKVVNFEGYLFISESAIICSPDSGYLIQTDEYLFISVIPLS